MSAVKKRLSLFVKGMSEEGFSVALKCFISYSARYTEWVFNLESWRSQVAVEESFPHAVLLSDDPKLRILCCPLHINIMHAWKQFSTFELLPAMHCMERLYTLIHHLFHHETLA